MVLKQYLKLLTCNKSTLPFLDYQFNKDEITQIMNMPKYE